MVWFIWFIHFLDEVDADADAEVDFWTYLRVCFKTGIEVAIESVSAVDAVDYDYSYSYYFYSYSYLLI